TVHIDDPRARMIRRSQDLIEEFLGSRRIPVLREIEIERGAAGVHGPEQINPAPGDPNIGLIDSPGSARLFQVPPDSPVQFGNIALPPAPACSVVDAQVSFRHQLFQITIAEGEAEIPSDAESDDLVREVSSPEKC